MIRLRVAYVDIEIGGVAVVTTPTGQTEAQLGRTRRPQIVETKTRQENEVSLHKKAGVKR